ncbi:MAG: thiamine pyrophosphate-binding protein, partial [Alphaproteobacteria bacterium]
RPIRPEAVVAALRALLDDEAVICADPGTPCPYFSAYYRQRVAGRQFITNRAHGALGFSLGAAIGAQVGRPNARVVAAMGDGSFAMCCGELETLGRYGLPITVVVFSNATFGWIKAGQNAGFGRRFYNVDFSRTDHAAVARAFGLAAWRVEEPRALRPALAAALAHDGPALVDVLTQPLHEAAAPVSEWVA